MFQNQKYRAITMSSRPVLASEQANDGDSIIPEHWPLLYTDNLLRQKK